MQDCITFARREGEEVGGDNNNIYRDRNKKVLALQPRRRKEIQMPSSEVLAAQSKALKTGVPNRCG